MLSKEQVIAQKKAQRDKENVDALKRDVKVAREALLRRYPRYVNEEETPTGFFDTSNIYCQVEFPDVDLATVTLVKFGQPMVGTHMEFRLSWQGRRMYWKGDVVLRRELLGTENEFVLYAGIARGRP